MYVGVLLFAVLLGGCKKGFDYEEDIKQQIPIDFFMIYGWLGQDFKRVDEETQKYVRTGEVHVIMPKGTFTEDGKYLPFDAELHSFMLPNYSQKVGEAIDYLISVHSEVVPVGENPIVNNVVVSKVHEAFEVYLPSDRAFISVILNIMQPSTDAPGVGIRAGFKVLMEDGKVFDELLLGSKEVDLWKDDYATPYELKKLQMKLAEFIAEHGGNKAVVRAQIGVDLFATKDWVGLIDHVPGTEYRKVSFSKSFQREGWVYKKTKDVNGKTVEYEEVADGYQSTVFLASMLAETVL